MMLTGRDEMKLEALQKSLSQKVAVSILALDLTQPQQRSSLCAWMQREAPQLVVNCAGFGLYGEAVKVDMAKQLEMIDLNVSAVTELSIEAVRSLKAHKKTGVIVNVASAAAFQPLPYFAVYSASKAYVTTFSQALDSENEEAGIRVLAACPGVVNTNFQKTASFGTKSEAKGLSPMTAAFAAGQIFSQIEKKKPLHIFDYRYRLMAWFTHFFRARTLIRNEMKKRLLKRQ